MKKPDAEAADAVERDEVINGEVIRDSHDAVIDDDGDEVIRDSHDAVIDDDGDEVVVVLPTLGALPEPLGPPIVETEVDEAPEALESLEALNHLKH